ncbi:glycoside hydrolase family 36 protein [Nitriliruptor alkaliphilus]|uniref:glycoside hydrolase family 36 protein n=1 Tax=Nitriliruptor alkaliphilus TaxID=427918 RepID=UPI0009F81DEB|nr:glycoside hydrolase family 36 protein [Nitriliruptor alkaliphilus]
MSFHPIAEVRVDPRVAIVYEHGWQSWSPAGAYRVAATTPRPARPRWQTMAFRPERPAPAEGAQGEGLLALQPEPGAPVTVWSAPDPHREVPTLRSRLTDGDLVVVEVDGDVYQDTYDTDLDEALRRHGDTVVRRQELPNPPALGTGWCSWYGYWGKVTEADVRTNLAAADELDLPIDTIQLDDGYQTEIGDWLTRRTDRFPSPLADLASAVAATGRSAGIWTAPFCVGADSVLAATHPDWLVGGAEASDHHWGQRIGVLDVTHPDAAAHLVEVMRTLTSWGFSYHKIDFLYAGAIPGRRYADCSPLDAYGEGLRLVREAIGPDAVLLGCGAPLLPSIGRVDAMRTSPDIDPTFTPPEGDVSQPSQQGALLAGRARSWQHGRFWTNDPDCILVRAEVEDRDGWARYLAASGGLAVSGDPLPALDDHGLALTRALLTEPRAEGGRWVPDPDNADAGRLAGEDAGVRP